MAYERVTCTLPQKNYTKLTVIRIGLDLGMLVKGVTNTVQDGPSAQGAFTSLAQTTFSAA